MNVSAPTDYRFPFDEPVLLAINGLQWDWLDAVWVALSDKVFGIGCAVVHVRMVRRPVQHPRRAPRRQAVRRRLRL